MHWIEGLMMVAAGFIPWSIAAGWFPGDPGRRRELEERLPFVRNKAVLKVAAAFLWALGAAAVLGFVK